jgi:hypothetical protein
LALVSVVKLNNVPFHSKQNTFVPYLIFRVTRLGEISPFGQFFMAFGKFLSRKKLPNDLGKILASHEKIAQN